MYNFKLLKLNFYYGQKNNKVIFKHNNEITVRIPCFLLFFNFYRFPRNRYNIFKPSELSETPHASESNRYGKLSWRFRYIYIFM